MRARWSAEGSEKRLSELLTSDMYPGANGGDEDQVVDFTNAVLYVGALQIIFATVLVSLVSILSCVVFPTSAVSAVRTLVLSSLAGALLIRKPFRLGRTHGLILIFNALRPAVPIYIATLIFEQLVHSCARDAASPSYRRLIFHSMTIVCMLSGLARARRPLAHTDRPFLATSSALFVIAMLPPPAVVLSGPLCANTTFSLAAERLARAFVFSLLYSIFVYASAPPVQCSGETLICTMRASAASIWVLGCHALLLPLAAVQAGIVIYVRIYNEETAVDYEASYEPVPEERLLVSEQLEAAVDEEAAVDYGENKVHTTSYGHGDQQNIQAESSLRSNGGSTTLTGMITPSYSALGPRTLVDISGVPACNISSGIASDERMRQIAAQFEQH